MSSSTKAEGFSFDTEFSEDGSVLNEGGSAYRRYTRAELEDARETARQEALQSVEAETQRRLAASAEAIAAGLMPALPFALQLSEQLRRESAELALHVAKKIAGRAVEQFAPEAVSACLTEAASNLPQKAIVSLKIHPELEPAIAPLLAALQPPGTTINLVPDPSAVPGAWTMEWETGALSHDPAALSEKLEALVENYLVQPIEPQGDLFTSVA